MHQDSKDEEFVNVGLISPEGIDRIVSFIPLLTSIPEKKIAYWGKVKVTAKSVTGLYLAPVYHPKIRALMESLRENHFVQPFDWPRWKSTPERMINQPEWLEKATLKTCIKLITAHVRSDRFVGGHFGEMVRCGHITAILNRLAELREPLAVRMHRSSHRRKRVRSL